MAYTGSHISQADQSGWIEEFVNGLPVGVFRTTPEGRFIFCNTEFARIFGFSSADELKEHSIVSLHWDKKDRGAFFKEITEKGYVRELSLPFRKKEDIPIWCSITARVVYDEEQMPVFFDGTILEITREMEEQGWIAYVHNVLKSVNDYFCILGLDGRFLGINRSGAEMLGFSRKAMMGRRLSEVIAPRYRQRLGAFLTDIQTKGQKEGVLTVNDRQGRERNLEFSAFLVTKRGSSRHIICAARDITERLKTKREQLKQKKLQGVMEMAGGVSHRLNQRLMIINNLINGLLAGVSASDPGYEEMLKIHEQILKLNELAKKIGGIKKYESMDYVAGIKIVDIDKAT